MKEFLNEANPFALLIGEHRNEIRDVIANHAKTQRGLIPQGLTVIESVLPYVNETACVHSPDYIMGRSVVDHATIRVLVADDSRDSVLHSCADRSQLTRHLFSVLEANVINKPLVAPLPGRWRFIGFAYGLHERVWNPSFKRPLVGAIGMVRDANFGMGKLFIPVFEPKFRFLKLSLRRHPVRIGRPLAESVLIDFVSHVDDHGVDTAKESLSDVNGKI
jgi:hypothetical protein